MRKKIAFKKEEKNMCEEKKDYGATLNLPKTEFPMRGNLPENEPKILEEIFVKLRIIIGLRNTKLNKRNILNLEKKLTVFEKKSRKNKRQRKLQKRNW